MATNTEKTTDSSLKDLVNNLVNAIKEKNPDIKEHSERVAKTCMRFCIYLGLPRSETNQLYLAGLLHDIGIIYVPMEIAKKCGQLSDEEMEVIKKHPLISEKIVSKYEMLNKILPMIRSHHETIDGSGYPDGLKGDEIPFGAKIIGLISCYDVMTSKHTYLEQMDSDKALAEIKSKAGTHYDEDLVNQFVKFIESENTNKTPDTEQQSESEVSEDKPVEGTDKKIHFGSVQEIIEDIVHRFKKDEIDMPVLPKVVTDIQRVMGQQNTTVSTLASVIERDAVISVKLIAVSNSPVYRGTEKILTVNQAIPRLGIKETRNIVNTIANKSLYNVKNSFFKKSMERLWLHSLAAAQTAKALASELSLGELDTFFFMGLIHDIGKVLLLKAFSDVYSLDESMDVNEIIDNIQEVHTSFGSAILRKWGFSEKYARVALLHQGPKFKPDMDDEILVINLAGKIASSIGFYVDHDKNIDPFNLDSARLLGVDSDTIEQISDEVKEMMKSSSGYF